MSEKRGQTQAGWDGGLSIDVRTYARKLFNFCRKISYCSFSGGQGGFGRAVLGCVRQLKRTGFFCV